jgi:hypothetical protein
MTHHYHFVTEKIPFSRVVAARFCYETQGIAMELCPNRTACYGVLRDYKEDGNFFQKNLLVTIYRVYRFCI